ncbi:uncharacterized protein [Euphorbia lathyris]|uniref:uncharacterized protein isoform X2 n=1 Tax=Euphorbia lathyris TaxID=212925 RepID=UPI00331392F1
MLFVHHISSPEAAIHGQCRQGGEMEIGLPPIYLGKSALAEAADLSREISSNNSMMVCKCNSPLARAGFKMLAASIAPSAAPAPIKFTMSRKYDCISDINATKEKWRIKARIIRLWSGRYKNMGMVFLDEQGSTIEAQVRENCFFKFSKELEEGKTYAFEFFQVAENAGIYRASKHRYQLKFMSKTCVKEISYPLIKEEKIEIVSIDTILAKSIDVDFLVVKIRFPAHCLMTMQMKSWT